MDTELFNIDPIDFGYIMAESLFRVMSYGNGVCCMFYYPRPVLAFGYCHRPCLCICQCVCVSVCVSITCLTPVTHVLQPVGDCLATKKQLQPMQPLCDQKLHFSVADQSATGRRQLSLSTGDQSATGRRLVGDWLPIDWKWVAIGRQLVGDWSAIGRRWVGDWLLIKQSCIKLW